MNAIRFSKRGQTLVTSLKRPFANTKGNTSWSEFNRENQKFGQRDGNTARAEYE